MRGLRYLAPVPGTDHASSHQFSPIVFAAGIFSAPATAQDVRNPAPIRIPTLFGQTLIIGTYFPKEVVNFSEKLPAGTIVINTTQRRLYYVTGEEKRCATRSVSVRRATPGPARIRSAPNANGRVDSTAEMRKRKPGLPAYMPGGKDNPLGARALYLGNTLYRIHGTNEPWLMGAADFPAAFA